MKFCLEHTLLAPLHIQPHVYSVSRRTEAKSSSCNDGIQGLEKRAVWRKRGAALEQSWECVKYGWRMPQVWTEDAPGMGGRCPGYAWTMLWVWTEDVRVWMEDAPSFCKREAQTWFIGPWMLLGDSKRKQWPNSSSPHGPYLSCGPNSNTVMGLLYFLY